MKKIRVLSVCGSGVLSSTMVAQKLGEALKEHGYGLETTEVTNGQIRTALAGGDYDCICYASPVREQFDIPCINAIGLLTGVGEEEVIEQVLEVARTCAK